MYYYYASTLRGCEHHGNGNFLISDHLAVVWVGAAKLYCVQRDLRLVQTRDLRQAWTQRRWKYFNNLTRKYEISLIIVYIAKTLEPNRINPDSNETDCNSISSETGWLHPRGEEDDWSPTLFGSDLSRAELKPGTRNSSHHRGRKR